MLQSFGDIFRYQESEYVYLTTINDSTFAAKILDQGQTAVLSRVSEKRAARPDAKPNEKLWAFVVLTTTGFVDRAAHLGSSDTNDGFVGSCQDLGRLCDEDIEKIKKEIIDSNGVPIALKEYVKTI